MESLADFLGANDRWSDKDPVSTRTPTASPRLSSRLFFRQFLHSPEYRQSLIDRVRLGTLPPALEVLMHHYAYGKPVEHVEVKDKTERVEDLTVEEIEKRVLELANIARQLRKEQTLGDQEDPTESVH